MTVNKVGGEVEAYCGKCKLERTHKIVAVDPDGTIVKVVCTTCDSYHKYRAPKAPKVARPKVRGEKAEKAKAVAFSVDELMSKPARPYLMSSYYQVGEVIDHSTFGRGQVVTIQESKIEVQFRVGTKLLVHGRG